MFHAVPFMAQLGSNILPQSQSIPGHCLPCRARALLINNGTARAAAGPTPRPRPLEGRQLCGEPEALRSSPAAQAGERPSARLAREGIEEPAADLFQPHGRPARWAPQSSTPAGVQHLPSIPLQVGFFSGKRRLTADQAVTRDTAPGLQHSPLLPVLPTFHSWDNVGEPCALEIHRPACVWWRVTLGSWMRRVLRWLGRPALCRRAVRVYTPD